MKTTFSKRFGLFCLLMLSVEGAQAQIYTYPKVENNNTIVSRDAAGGIKKDALLTPVQKAFLMNQAIQPIYNEKSEYNRVSAKFEVASTDASAKDTWVNAYTLCKDYSQADAVAGSWRVPTQRELMLIWMFKSQLTDCGTIASDYFWSSTEHSIYASTAWCVYFSNGGITYGNDGCLYTVRCIRDL